MFIDYVAKAAAGFARHSGKKDRKKGIPSLPDGKLYKLGKGAGFWNAGFASCDLTPPDLLTKTYWMAGYNIGKKIRGFLDPLTANAMWIDCGDGTGAIFVSCDLIGLTGYDVKILRDNLQNFCKTTGCVNVTISCTHTHAGIDTMGYWGALPRTGKDKAFMTSLSRKIKEICYEAYRSRTPGKLFYGNIEAPELNDRWRRPKFKNATLHRFRFVPRDGSAETWFLNFPAHPNTLGGKNVLLSADYPCYMRREIKSHKDVNIMYTIGAIGATDIADYGETKLEITQNGGRLLGKKALEITAERELAPRLTLLAQHFVMPIDNPVLLIAGTLQIFTNLRCGADSQTGAGFISELNYFDFDGVKILTCPGEMFHEIVYSGGYESEFTSANGLDAGANPTPLAEIFDAEKLIIFGVTNDMAGYAMAPNDFVLHDTAPFIERGRDRFGRSHYHETNSCGIKTAETIAETCRRMKNIIEQG